MPAKVLVVDDDESYRLLLSRYLVAAGYTVAVAAGSSAAISIASDYKPDALIIDWMLKDAVHGLDLMYALREEGIHCPVILISGYLSIALEASARDAGVACILAKPFSIDVLLREVEKACGSGVEGSKFKVQGSKFNVQSY